MAVRLKLSYLSMLFLSKEAQRSVSGGREGVGPDPAFPLLFHENPAFRLFFFFIAYPNSSFVFKNNNNNVS